MIEAVLTIFCLLSAHPLRVSSHLNDCYFDTDDAVNDILMSASAHRRRVDQQLGENTTACLNGSVPCRSFHYALHGVEEENRERSSVRDLVVELGEGTYVLTGSQQIINSVGVAIIGAGPDKTILQCGEFGEKDRVCDYMNLQIRNSTNVVLRGLTFTRCGPITSSLYIALSDNVYLQDCVFRDTLSPPVLVYNTPTIVLDGCTFSNNHPAELSPDIVHDICYFSGGEDIFFVDNRTTSGGVSFYIKDQPTTFLVLNSQFVNNSARPDPDVSLVRYSTAYGHGGALNIRLLHSSNSTACIVNTSFIENSAQAHGGGVVLSLAGNASNNHFVVLKSLFERNYCTVDQCTGGGVGLDLLAGSQFNFMEINDTMFRRNKATASGAISLSTSVSAEVSGGGVSDILVLTNCSFIENEAFYEGTALGAYSLTHADQIGIPLDIYDCEFRENGGTGGSADTTAITVYRVLISFYGNTSFLSNRGGGVSLLSSRMDVKGGVVFYNNTAVFGGGVAMSGRSLILLYEKSYVNFSNNAVSQFGAGIYVEYASSDFLLSVLNTGCFIRYYTTAVDIQPTEWRTQMVFIDNTAKLAGAGIYANDMSRCMWLGSLPGNHTIFDISPSDGGPFTFMNNMVQGPAGDQVTSHNLATDASQFSSKTDFNTSNSTVAFGERVSFNLSSSDELNNFREAVWTVKAPLELQPLGSVSNNNSRYVYTVPDKLSLSEAAGVQFTNGSEEIIAEFSLLQTIAVREEVRLRVAPDCHPGYRFDNDTQQCQCMDDAREVLRCDALNRYFYTQDGFWIGVREDGSVYGANAIPGFLDCSRLGALPGCLFKFDTPDQQCSDGRTGQLCGDCQPGYGVTFDLRYCKQDCGVVGIILFIGICVITLIVSLIVLYFDLPLPNELKSVIFFAQVIGVIYRNTPYLIQSEDTKAAAVFDFILNMLGFAMPIPFCFYENVSAFGAAFLGFFPPLIGTLTAISYSCCANRSRKLSHRDKYGFHGFYFLFLFIYKYFVDTCFTFISCTDIGGEKVFLYQGTLACYRHPFVFMFVVANILLVALVIVLPLYALYIIYRPAKMIQFSNALTHGLKEDRSYLWYSVWDIWRRVLFVGTNLFIAVTTRSVVLFIHCLLILLSLCVLCIVKPYKKYHINVMEMLVLLWLFGATVSILDENDLYVGLKVSAIFVSLPFVYGIVFILYRVLRSVTITCWSFALKRWKIVRLEAALSSVNSKLSEMKRLAMELLEEEPSTETNNQDDGEFERRGEEEEEEEEEDRSRGNSGEGGDINHLPLRALKEPLLEQF